MLAYCLPSFLRKFRARVHRITWRHKLIQSPWRSETTPLEAVPTLYGPLPYQSLIKTIPHIFAYISSLIFSLRFLYYQICPGLCQVDRKHKYKILLKLNTLNYTLGTSFCLCEIKEKWGIVYELFSSCISMTKSTTVLHSPP